MQQRVFEAIYFIPGLHLLHVLGRCGERADTDEVSLSDLVDITLETWEMFIHVCDIIHESEENSNLR